MSRNEGWSRWNREDMRMTAVKSVPHFTPQHWLLCHMGLY